MTALAVFRPELGAAFDLSTRAKLRITGADRLRYLNGQISNDLRRATAAQSIHACVLSAKGKINAEVFIHAERESFLVDTDTLLREQLVARLERYVIADDVQLEDVTDDFALLHVIGGNVPTLSMEHAAVSAARFGVPGADYWLQRSQREAALKELVQSVSTCDDACAEVFRIERGVPRWGHELTEEIIPTEANLEANTIDYAKGCYIGQEVISRIKMSGQTNKRLCGFVLVNAAAGMSPGARLFTMGEGKDVGWITSTTASGRLGKQIALGFVKRGFQDVGTELLARSTAGDATIRITALPFS